MNVIRNANNSRREINCHCPPTPLSGVSLSCLSSPVNGYNIKCAYYQLYINTNETTYSIVIIIFFEVSKFLSIDLCLPMSIGEVILLTLLAFEGRRESEFFPGGDCGDYKHK